MLRNDLLEFDPGIKKEEFQSCWNLEEGLVVARLIEPIALANRYHTALAGGVLIKGSSSKDLDIILYQRSVKEPPCSPEDFIRALKPIGFSNFFYKCKGDRYKEPSMGDFKCVYVCSFFSKRVDLFFLRAPAVKIEEVKSIS